MTGKAYDMRRGASFVSPPPHLFLRRGPPLEPEPGCYAEYVHPDVEHALIRLRGLRLILKIAPDGRLRPSIDYEWHVILLVNVRVISHLLENTGEAHGSGCRFCRVERQPDYRVLQPSPLSPLDASDVADQVSLFRQQFRSVLSAQRLR